MAAKKTAKKTSRTPAELKEQFTAVNNAPRQVVDRATTEAIASEASRVRGAVSALTADSLVVAIAKSGTDIQRTLGQLQANVAEEFQKLSDIQAAVKLAETELETLYSKEVVAASIEQLLQDFAAKEKGLNELYAEMSKNAKEQYEQRLAQFSRDEVERHQARTREEETFTFERNRKRQQDAATFDDQVAAKKRAEAIRREELEREWSTREAALAAKEKEVISLREQVETFPALSAKEVERAVAIATNSVKKDLTQTFELAKKDFELNLKLAEARALNAEAEKVILNRRIVDLEAAVKEANERAATVASQAVNAAAGGLALQKVTELASSTGNGTRGPNKA